MKKILVIGASGFVGRHLAKGLLSAGYAVRCAARTPSRVAEHAEGGCEIVQGDFSDAASMERALAGMEAVYVSVHTLSQQPGSAAGDDFLEVEKKGLRNIVQACQANGVRRLIYVTFLGISPDSPSAWVRGRWDMEQLLLQSGLDVTMVRPAQIVGVGGHGFDMMVSQARKRVALVLGDGRGKWRNIAVDDLVYYMVGMLADPRAYGQCYDVGCDDILTNDQMLDLTAGLLGRKSPFKVRIPGEVLIAFAPLIERMAKLPKGAIKGIAAGLGSDMVGDPMPIRKILPRPLMTYRQAVERALGSLKRN